MPLEGQPDGALVLVTGASGFLGSALVAALLGAGYRVRALVRAQSSRRYLDAADEIVVGDIRDPDAVAAAVKGVRFLVHAAADYRLWTRDPAALLATNLEGTRHLAEAALDAGVERFVHTSSVATLIPGGAEPGDETRRLAPEAAVGLYKKSKILAERLIDDMVAARGLPAVIVNPSTPIGPRDARPTPTGRIILAAARGAMPAFVDTGLNLAHVEDVAAGHVLALQKGGIGEHYILGGENVTLAALLGEVAACRHTRPPRVKLAYPLAYGAAIGAELVASLTGKEPLATRDGVRMSRHTMFFDDAKARRELGYVSRPYQQSVADAVNWFLAEGYLS